QLQTLTATVNPASFAVTSPISGSKVKDTVTVTWAASPGARDYTVSYGTTTACSTTLLTTSSTSANITAGLNATEYVCVRANGYTGASPGTPQMAATSNASYLLIIDNSGPTGAITAPGAVTYIGPLTTAMGSGSTTTYAGTAADSQAGVQKVEVQLQQGTNYWTGATWSAIPTWLLAAGTASWTYVINDSDMNTAGDAANYTLRVQVTDNAGNVTSAAASKAFTWKSVAPTAILTGKPGTLLVTDYYSNSTNIGVSVGGALVKDYKYAIVSGSTCGSPTYGSFTGFATNITGNPGGDGQYTLCVLARDEAENVQVSPTIHTWYKDVVAPSISGLSAQSVNAAYTPSPSVTDSGAPVGSVISYVWSVETASNSCSVTFGGSGSASQAPTISLSGCATNTYGNFGAPTLKLTATDTAGNSSSSSFVLTWDQETPRVSVITSPLATGHYKAGQVVPVTVKFVKSGSNPNVSTYALIVTGSPILTLNTTPAQNATASAGTVVNSSSSVTLTFNYTVQSGDNSGSQSGVLLNVASATALALSGGTIKDNIGTGNSALLTGLPTSGASSLVNKSVNIDTAAPTLAFSSGLPSAQSKITTMAIAISATDTTTYTYALISGSSAGCSGASYVGSATGVGTNITNNITSSPNLADGTVTICAQATDLAGNVQSGYTSYTWTKDTVAPAVLTISAPTGQISSATPTVTWSAPAGDVNGIELLVSKTSGCGSNIVESYLYSGGTYGQ
ncbi:MAG: hypothetical protein NTV34_13820, partial [Proteobacteria bacterium]|nr:hypothetical protein [Pseudomonadota bacterium]